MTHRTAATTSLLAALTLAGGCAGIPKGNNLPDGLKLPPAPPKRVAMPLDDELRRQADAEIARNYASTDATLRANAIEATQKTAGAADAPRLLSALTDKSPVVRFAGAMAVGTLRIEAARPRLLSMVDDPSVSVQVGVRFALHRLGDTHLSHDFERFSQDRDDVVRGNTAVALGLLGEPSAMTILKVMQHDPNPTVRLQVVEAMFRLNDDNAFRQLIGGTLSQYADDQVLSILALGGAQSPEMKKNVMRYVRGALTSEWEETKLAAARADGMLGWDDGMAIALKDADSRDARQRSMAALALGDIGRSDAQPTLKKLLDDKDPAVRLAAATAILQLKA